MDLLKIFLVLLMIDIPVITILNKKMYIEQFNRINKTKNYGVKLIPAICAYLILAIVLQKLISWDNPEIEHETITIIALGIYGVYNTTNIATIEGWGIKESVVDTLWGIVFLNSVVYLLKQNIIDLSFVQQDSQLLGNLAKLAQNPAETISKVKNAINIS